MDLSPEKTVTCDRCGFTGPLKSFNAAMSVYHDIACPECGSTNNRHNGEFQDGLFKDTGAETLQQRMERAKDGEKNIQA